MKKITNIIMALLLTGPAFMLTLSSCQKKFDAKSYAPKKPSPAFGGYNFSNQIAPDSLVAYWNLNGTLTDSISKLPGTATSSTFAAGIFGQAYQGSANKTYAVCGAPQALAALQKVTVSAWVNTTPPTTGVLDYFTLANTKAFWGNIEMFFDNGSTNTDAHLRIHLSSNGNDNTYAAEVPGCFNGWAHIVFSYDTTGKCKLYLNGQAVVTASTGTVPLAPDTIPVGTAISGKKYLHGSLVFQNVGNVVFGCTQFLTVPSQTTGASATDAPWAAYFPGKIDQVRVFNKVLSSNEVSALYNLENLGR
jgi:hypothetical protein